MRDVAFSCDDRGARFLEVAVWSLLDRYRGAEPLRINVFEGWGGHSKESKGRLAEIVARFPGASLRYVDVEKALEPFADVIAPREGSRWNVFTWTPVFTPLLLPDAEGVAIHFDIDMLFNADVSPLFGIDFSRANPDRPELIACAYEYDNRGNDAGRVVWETGILPPEVERYFNTGVLVFNLAACRAERTWEKIADWYRAHRDIADRIEQDAWNALYWDRVHPLHVKWNFHDRSIKNYAHWPLASRYWLGNPPRECLEAALNPCILHFWGPKKPWKPSHRPYRRLYHAAMRAVGQKPPREEFLGWLNDFTNACAMEDVRETLRCPAEAYPHLAGDRKRLVRKMRFRRALRAVRRAALVPFEWLAIGIGLAILPRVGRRTLLRLCDMAGAAMYAFDGKGRRRALENLHVLAGTASGAEGTFRFDPGSAPYRPTPRERMIVKGSYRNMARAVGHAFWTSRDAERKVREAGELSAECKAILGANRPVVTVSAHVGCWEILSQLALLEGHAMMSVAKDVGTAGMTRLLMKARRSIGQEIVPAEGAFVPLMAGLRGGKSLGLLVDQRVSPEDGGVWVRFCGRPVPVSAAPAFFAAKAKVPIAVAWSRPLADGRYRCELVEMISAGEAKDVWAVTQRCAADIERLVRRHPSRWVLNYNMYGVYASERDLAALAARERRSK